jgi:DNA-binding transcriptional LysR family regulator
MECATRTIGRRATGRTEVFVGLEIRHLRAIVAIADAGSLNRAARTLGMTQPALTGQLQRIERKLGGQLFIRTGIGCGPTLLGQEVVNEARAVLRGMDSIEQYAKSTGPSASRSTPIRLGGHVGFLKFELSQWLAAVPWTTGVSLWDEPIPQVSVDMVAQGSLDMALVYDWPPSCGVVLPDGVREQVIHPAEPVFVLASPELDLPMDSVSLKEVSEHPWLDEPPGLTPWSVYLRQVCHHEGVTLVQRHSTIFISSMLELVFAGLAIAPVKATSRRYPGQAIIHDLTGRSLRQCLRLVYRTGSAVETHLTEICAQLANTYSSRQGCNDAFDDWWADEGKLLLSTF